MGNRKTFTWKIWNVRSFLLKFIIFYVLFIYMTLPVMPILAKSLRRAAGEFYGVVVSSGILLLIFLIFRKVRSFLVSRKEKFWAGFLIFTGVSTVALLDIPAERIHFLEYGLLGTLLVRYFSFSYPLPKRYFLAFFVGTMCGIIDEFLQLFLQVQTIFPFLPRRYFEVKDIIQNIFGVYLGIIFYHYIIEEGQRKLANMLKGQ